MAKIEFPQRPRKLPVLTSKLINNRIANSFTKNKLLTISGTALTMLAIYAHIRLIGMDDYAGPLAALDRIFDVAIAVAAAMLAFCVGRRLSRLLKLCFDNSAEEVSFSVMAGSGLIGLAVLSLGLLGLLRPIPVTALLLVLTLAAGKEAVGFLAVCNQAVREAIATKQRRVISLYLGFLVLLLYIRVATPPWAYDDEIYHLPATESFVESGGIYPLYDKPLGNMPFLVHMIYAFFLMVRSDIAAKGFCLILALTTSVAIYGFCTRFLNRRTGLLAVFGFFATSMVVEVAVSTRIDVTLAGMLFLTTYALMVYLENNQRGWLYASALLGGFSLGIKLNALIWLALLGLMLVIESWRSGRFSLFSICQRLLLYYSLVFAIASPWMVKNLIWFRNPVYPFLTGEIADITNGRVRYFNLDDERKLDAHFDSTIRQAPNESHDIQIRMEAAAKRSPERHPFRFWEYYTKPSLYFMGDHRHYSNFLFLAAPLYFLSARRKWLTWLFIINVGFFSFIAATSWLARFLLPIYPSLTIISAYTLNEIGKKVHPLVTSRLPIYALAASMAVPMVVSFDYIVSMHNLSFLIGTRSRHAFLSQHSHNDPIHFINANLPSDSRVMFLGVQMCYEMKRQYLSDETWDNTQWRRALIRNVSLEGVNEDLKSRGVTHILFGVGFFEFAARTGWPKPGGSAFLGINKLSDPERTSKFGRDYTYLRNWTTFDLYRRQYLELIYSDDLYQIYRLK